MAFTEQITERLALAAGVAPQTLNNARLNSDAVDMSKSRRALFILSIGAVTGGGSINWYLQESADNTTWTANDTAGAFSSSGGTNTSVTGLTTSNKVYSVECRDEDLTSGKRYVRLQIKETGSQNVLVCVTAFGDEGNHKPNNANNAAAVTTQKVVT